MSTKDLSARAAQLVASSSVMLVDEIEYGVWTRGGEYIEVGEDGKAVTKVIEPEFLRKGSGRASGSGAVVSYYASEDKSLVLTAWHVCETYEVGQRLNRMFYDIVITSVKRKVFSAENRSSEFSIIYQDKSNDLCIVETDGVVGNVASVAHDTPPHGAEIMTAGAPAGLWGIYNASIRDGRYQGVRSKVLRIWYGGEMLSFKNFLYWSIPGRGGTSGSGVYYNGKLFSIHNASGWTHSGYGPPTDKVRDAIHKAKVIYAMSVVK
jgi:hypothetical protein